MKTSDLPLNDIYNEIREERFRQEENGEATRTMTPTVRPTGLPSLRSTHDLP